MLKTKQHYVVNLAWEGDNLVVIVVVVFSTLATWNLWMLNTWASETVVRIDSWIEHDL